jgi:hypothetical protein
VFVLQGGTAGRKEGWFRNLVHVASEILLCIFSGSGSLERNPPQPAAISLLVRLILGGLGWYRRVAPSPFAPFGSIRQRACFAFQYNSRPTFARQAMETGTLQGGCQGFAVDTVRAAFSIRAATSFGLEI